MSYDTEHDFEWVLRALSPRGQTPGAAPQELPHVVTDLIHPKFDALGWSRYGSLLFETASTLNSSLVNLPVVPSGEAHLYTYAHVRPTGGSPPASASLTLVIVEGATFAAVGPAFVGSLDGQVVAAIRKPILVPAGFNFGVRSDQASGVGVTLNLETFKIILTIGEYVVPT